MTHVLPPATAGCLDGLKVLDLSQRYSHYCGKVFADMGADVVLIEKPGSGCALRGAGRYISGHVDAEYSIPHFYYNTSKRGITLDLDHPRGVEIFLKLAREADLVIEDMPPGALDRLHAGHKALSAVNRRIVLTSITPFGQTGPYAHYAADDLALLALGGFLNMTGYPDMYPTQPYGNQAYAMGNMFAMVGSMLVVLQAQTSGRGQHVDISIQECVTMALENASQFYDLEQRVRTRFAGTQRQAGTGIFECADGYVYLFAGGMAAIRFWPNLVAWLKEMRVPSVEIMESPRWADMAFVNSDEAKDTFAKLFSSFARTRTKEALYRDGQTRRVPICPVSTPADVARNQQLKYRSFFANVRHAPSNQDVMMPGAPFQLAQAPWQVRRAAPALGEHNSEVYASIGVDADALRELQSAGVV